MSKSRVAAITVVVVLVAAAGALALRSWVGIDEGESLAGDDPRPGTTPSASPSTVDPGPTTSPSRSPSPSPTATPSPTPSEPGRENRRGGAVSPAGIAGDIQSRLDRSGPATTVRCPQAVSPAVGTSFSCSVAFADAPGQTVADATVNIVGSGLRYVWRSSPR